MEGNRGDKRRIGTTGKPAVPGNGNPAASAAIDPSWYEAAPLPEWPAGGLPDPAVLQGLDAVLPLPAEGCPAESGERNRRWQYACGLLGVPYAGAGVRQSVLGGDRSLIRRLLAQEGLPQGLFRSFTRDKYRSNPVYYVMEIEMAVGYPCRILPARSFGREGGLCRNRTELEAALDAAFSADSRVVAEEWLAGRRLAVALLAGREQLHSGIAEQQQAGFGSPGQDRLAAAVGLPGEAADRVMTMARQACELLDAEGAVLVTFLEAEDNKRILLDSVELSPDLGPESAYARLWKLSGVPYPGLVRLLVDHAVWRQSAGLSGG